MFEFLRKDLILVLAVAAVFVSLSYAIGFVTDRDPTPIETQPAFLEGDRAPKAQSVTTRVWKKHAFEKLLALGKPAVTKPVIVRAADNGDFYVLDWADLRIKMFSPEGNLLRVFGDGKGTGAGGFTNPTSFSIAPNGELWVCDPVQRKITHFQVDGVAHAIAPQNAVDRVTVLGDLLVTMAPPGSSQLFEVYSPSGKQLKSFGEFLQNQSQQGIILDGGVVSDPESDGFIYGGRHLGVIAGYDADGGQRFVAHTIDSNPLPKVLSIGGRLKVKPYGTPAVLSLSILDNELYVLSGAHTGDTAGGKVMDVYNSQDGHYLYSWELPADGQEAVVGANYIYIRSENEVTVWRFTSNT